MTDIRAWLTHLGLGKYGDVIADNEIDAEVLTELTDADLTDIGVPLGPRKKLLKAIREGVLADAPTVDTDATVASAQAERRQLTVLFCDLVGSTDMSNRLDPEDYRAVLTRFQNEAASCMRAAGGFVARFMGDGLLVYFGYPQAHENDADRAVRAALELASLVADMGGEALLAVRAGIATGPTVVGDVLTASTSQEIAALGATPNLAARLQSAARPGRVMISELTARLLQGDHASDKHQLTLKGFDAHVLAFEISALASPSATHAASTASHASAFVGRDEELTLLNGRWRRAGDGEGQVVLLRGEAGMGKSRLITEFVQQHDTSAGAVHWLEASPYHQSSPLYPFSVWLDRLIARSSDATGLTDESPDIVPALLEWQRGDDGDRSSEKRRVIDALLSELLHPRHWPCLIVIEDAHWLDPSSLELIAELAGAISNVPALVVCAHRPGFVPAWGDLRHQSTCVLSALSRREVAQLARSVAAEANIDASIAETVVDSADGLPLYAEELTRALLEQRAQPDATLREHRTGNAQGLFDCAPGPARRRQAHRAGGGCDRAAFRVGRAAHGRGRRRKPARGRSQQADRFGAGSA